MYGNGRGVPQDLVRAHMWLNLAAAASQPGARSERDLIAKKMTRKLLRPSDRLGPGSRNRPPRGPHRCRPVQMSTMGHAEPPE
jgi:TPR repeat protein